MAARAAELLINANGGESLSDAIDFLPFDLIVRGSTAPPLSE
jgi:DNA-binding LacI/PurR family transcriptional regulator